ncbi:hypothetical protein DSECCO2_634950 [anaerobic digester metagenome]
MHNALAVGAVGKQIRIRALRFLKLALILRRSGIQPSRELAFWMVVEHVPATCSRPLPVAGKPRECGVSEQYSGVLGILTQHIRKKHFRFCALTLRIPAPPSLGAGLYFLDLDQRHAKKCADMAWLVCQNVFKAALSLVRFIQIKKEQPKESLFMNGQRTRSKIQRHTMQKQFAAHVHREYRCHQAQKGATWKLPERS